MCDSSSHEENPGSALALPLSKVAIRQRWHVAERAVRNHLWDSPRRPNVAEGSAEWQRYFEPVVLDRWEMVEGNRLEIVLIAADPALARSGFAKYSKTWDRALEAAFGHVPQVRVVGNTQEAA